VGEENKEEKEEEEGRDIVGKMMAKAMEGTLWEKIDFEEEEGDFCRKRRRRMRIKLKKLTSTKLIKMRRTFSTKKMVGERSKSILG
jgi:hypothetical protein